VLVYLFQQKGTDDLALTIDVTGRNIPAARSSMDWLFVEALDTLKVPPTWHGVDFQRMLRLLRAAGFYLLEAEVKDPKNLPGAPTSVGKH
jgi:hypothetical protein